MLTVSQFYKHMRYIVIVLIWSSFGSVVGLIYPSLYTPLILLLMAALLTAFAPYILGLLMSYGVVKE